MRRPNATDNVVTFFHRHIRDLSAGGGGKGIGEPRGFLLCGGGAVVPHPNEKAAACRRCHSCPPLTPVTEQRTLAGRAAAHERRM